MTVDAAELEVVPYPPAVARRYRERGIWRPETIPQAFRASADAHPDAVAVFTEDERLTYAELDQRSDELAIGLAGLGLRPGDRVLVQLANSSLAVIIWYALLKAGLVPIATLPQHREHEILAIARVAEPKAHVVQADFAGHDLAAVAARARAAQPTLRVLLTVHAEEAIAGAVAIESIEVSVRPGARAAVEAIQARTDPESLAVLQLSGGTTSVPKLIPRLHTEYWYNSVRYSASVGLGPGDCALHLLPVVHNAGIVCGLHAAHAVGACFAMSPYDPVRLRDTAARCHPTHMFMAPPIARMVLDDDGVREALSSLRVVVWTLGKLPLEVREAFETSRCRIQQLYGQGEGLCMVTPAEAPAEVRHTTVGVPISDADEVRILEPASEQPVPPGVPGELCVRGPYTIRGYFRGGARNLEAFTSEGFYRTGDIAVEVAGPRRAFYAIEDRLKDVISRGGEKINALEVERLLVSHPAIEAAALVSMPDERLGERACAFIVLARGASAVSLQEVRHFFDHLGVAKFKWPERLEFRERLPLTSIDKVNKSILRQEIAGIVRAERESTAVADR